MPTVLIVEDDPHVASLYREKLRMAGYDVEVAADGKAGLQKALAERPAVMLLDMNLPEIDGTAVLKQLRADERGKDIPVIVLTNDTESDRLAEIKGLYSDYSLKVDLALDDLVEKIKHYVP
jgi:two-component system alkaline phosphatase synthesis response regulator PhoP